MATVAVNGLFLGLIYGLLGAGLVVVYRGSRVVNFAYGETGMIGAFVFIELWADHGVALLLALPAAVSVSAVLGAATEWVVARPLRHQPRLTVMVGTLGVASLLLVYAGRRWGLNPRFFPALIPGAGIRLAGLQILPAQLLVLGTSLPLLAALEALYRLTPFGLRLRATAVDPEAAGLVGVDTDRTSMASWALSGALAGLSAILIAPLVAFHVFFMTGLFVRGIAAALVGGLTSLSGAFAAGVLLGIAEAVVAFKTPVGGIVEVVLAVFVIGLLMVRPAGIVRSSY